ncbi:MAG: CDP-6-deoxy-delta-3,4-glucoseen reductase [Gammaproteobacteria bacterium]|nr:CDP-6-deoxy-delta-3,4-glucoseen reductase [Gammaproteobacteria bacterium]MBU1656006.1 CDP-6-deoxy-delta-3,4-glucoseen reductase [Gammaproteobacteria bacterium]MBU1962214.1 CDP-6-deoxy-delta-3,4-glucoseen reductase [Gammaproteobacteria bacterium]
MTFSVQIEPSGHSFNVERGETLLEAALRQGVGLPYGCRNGLCGSCLCRLSEGEVDYPKGKPDALKDQGDNACLSCQAIPVTDLLILAGEVEKADEIEIRTLPCRVESVENLAHDVIRLKLKLPESQRLQFLAGQYLDILLPDGRRRAFSIANAPHDDACIELHVRHVSGGEFTDFVFHGMQEKAILRIQAPLGGFTLREHSDRPMVFVAGGTGFAPIKGIIEHAFHLGEIRPIHLYWGVRSRRDLYLHDLPLDWEQGHANFRYTPVLSEPDSDWAGRTGWVHEAVLEDSPDMSSFDLYMAGPPPMIRSARDRFAAAGLGHDHMFYDSFEYAAPKEEPKGE